MMSLLRLTILVIFGVVTSQNHDENSQIPYGGRPRQRSVESTTLFPFDPKIDNEGIELLLTRLESLCVENLGYLITETNKRFQSLEDQSFVVHSTVNNIRDELGRKDDPFTRLENLLMKKLDNLTAEVGRLSQCCAVPATPVVQNNEILEAKVENLSKNVQELLDVTRNLPSDVEAIKKNVSSFINVTRSLVDSSSNLVSKQILNKGLQELNDSTSSCSPLNVTVDFQYPKNCREVRKSGEKASGIYLIQPEHAQTPFEAVCELETRGGDWTVIQRRFDGSQTFHRGWLDYKNGFGSLRGEFWLGLENIHLLTGYEVNELLIELGDFELRNKSAFYSRFSVGSEMEGYSLKVLSDYSGDASDSMTGLLGSKFSTIDVDQDNWEGGSWALAYDGGWWFHDGMYSNLNGNYYSLGNKIIVSNNDYGIYWGYYKSAYRNLKHSRMLVRPKLEVNP